jgi:hypothetical protein
VDCVFVFVFRDAIDPCANIVNAQALNNLSESQCSVQPLTWGIFDSTMTSAMPIFDLVLGADIFYNRVDFEDILSTVYYFMAKHPTGQCLFITAYQCRSSKHTISHVLQQAGLELVHHCPPSTTVQNDDDDDDDDDDTQMMANADVHVFVFAMSKEHDPEHRAWLQRLKNCF